MHLVGFADETPIYLSICLTLFPFLPIFSLSLSLSLSLSPPLLPLFESRISYLWVADRNWEGFRLGRVRRCPGKEGRGEGRDVIWDCRANVGYRVWRREKREYRKEYRAKNKVDKRR